MRKKPIGVEIRKESSTEYVIDGDRWVLSGGEWVCEHGVGHPGNRRMRALASMDRSRGATEEDKLSSAGVHGCDGCCGKKSFKKLMLIEAIRDS